MTGETGEQNDDADESEFIIVPVEIPLDDDVHKRAWKSVAATATSPETARETIGGALGEQIPDLELQSLVYSEFLQTKHDEQQAMQMLDEMAAQSELDSNGGEQ